MTLKQNNLNMHSFDLIYVLTMWLEKAHYLDALRLLILFCSFIRLVLADYKFIGLFIALLLFKINKPFNFTSNVKIAYELFLCRNASSGSGLSETGSLDRGKAALERRKKAAEEGSGGTGRVEITRVNPDSLIDQLIKATNLEHTAEESKCLEIHKFFN